MWSRRAQEYEAKISSGKIYELAEVVRDLNKGDDMMVDQSYSERQLFEKAYERILSEFQIVINLSPDDTKKKLDKALKRNPEGQINPVLATSQKIAAPEVSNGRFHQNHCRDGNKAARAYRDCLGKPRSPRHIGRVRHRLDSRFRRR